MVKMVPSGPANSVRIIVADPIHRNTLRALSTVLLRDSFARNLRVFAECLAMGPGARQVPRHKSIN